jgi:hypothetical protein
VTGVKRKAALLAGVFAGAVAGVLLRRRGAQAPPADPRADELRSKLAAAREGAADESDFEAAGTGAETIVEPEAPVEEEAEDVDTLRRRVHDDARAAAEEMRRSGAGPEEA